MVKLTKSPQYYAVLAAISYLMMVISFSGIFFLKEDIIGRLITGTAWSVVAFGWLRHYFYTRLKNQNR